MELSNRLVLEGQSGPASVATGCSRATTPAPSGVVHRALERAAWDDLVRGLLRWDLYGRLGWLEIKRRYRRTVIGPFWSALSLAIFIVALGTVGGGLWNQSQQDYLPFLSAGMVVWMMISGIISESCVVFVSSQSIFRQMRFDYSILVYALVWRNFIVFLHNLIIYAIVVVTLSPHLLKLVNVLAIAGIFLVLLNGAWIAIFLGLFCMRFRDLQQLVSSTLQICMFVTPIFWPPDSLSGARRFIFVTLNPLYHLIDVVRSPLVGRVPALASYETVTVITIVGWSASYLLFRSFRRRITYWS